MLPEDQEFNFTTTTGDTIKGVFVECDKFIDDVHVSPCCDHINVNLVEAQNECGCFECGYDIIGNITQDSCITSWSIKIETEGSEDINLVDLPIENNNIQHHVCLGDGNHKINLLFYRNGTLVCTREFERQCNPCDNIQIIDHSTRDFNKTHIIYCNPIKSEIRLNGVTCVDTIEIINIKNNTVVKTILVNGLQTLYDTLSSEPGQEYKMVFKSGNTYCEKLIKPRCLEIITSPDPRYQGNVQLSPIPPFCLGSLSVISSDTTEIYGISVIDPTNPENLIYLNTMDPAGPPFDLSSYMFLTNISVPENSPLIVDICFYDRDTNMVSVIQIDTSCGTYQQSFSYIESFSVYPNPVDESFTTDYELKDGADVEIEIFNQYGDKVGSYVKQFKLKGKHEEKINSSYLRTGLYYAVLKANNEQKVITVIVKR
jgi:hypothetical protein